MRRTCVRHNARGCACVNRLILPYMYKSRFVVSVSSPPVLLRGNTQLVRMVVCVSHCRVAISFFTLST